MLPSINGVIGGRDAGGRFTKGNRGGPGNPHVKRAQRLRAALLKTVTPVRMARVVEKLLQAAEGGDIQAARLVIERCLGPATAIDLVAQVEELERLSEEEN